jgi:hypothetical protein
MDLQTDLLEIHVLTFVKRHESKPLEYKDVVFSKPWCSVTEISGEDSVRNVKKKFCSCHTIHKVGTTVFFTMFHTQSTTDLSVAVHYGLRNTICLYSKDVASV